MTTLHMKTDEVRIAANKLDWAVEELYLKPRALRNSASELRSAWQGGKSSYYAGQLQQMGTVLQNEVIELQRLAKRLRNEVDEWEDADADGASGWRSIADHQIPIHLGQPAKNADDYEEFDLLNWSGKIVGGTVSVVAGAAHLSIENYRGFGRFINSIIGNQHGGYVGKMDKLGHLVRNSIDDRAANNLEYAGYGLSFGFGVAEDLRDKKSVFHAISSEGLETAMNAGISIGISRGIGYLIPGAGTAMLVYDASLLVGRIAVGGMEASGLHDQAMWLNSAIDVIDIGTYTERIADDVSDFVENTARKHWEWL